MPAGRVACEQERPLHRSLSARPEQRGEVHQERVEVAVDRKRLPLGAVAPRRWVEHHAVVAAARRTSRVTNARASSQIQRIAVSANPEAAALRRASAVACFETSTCTTSAPAAARASVAAPEWAKSESTRAPDGVNSCSHCHCGTCSRKMPTCPDGAGRTSSVMAVAASAPSVTCTCHGSGSDL